jgi:hypothetical protein
LNILQLTMRRIILIACFLPLGCATRQEVVTDPSVFQSHPKPYKIFGIGYWSPGYMILTLIDANNQYFTIKANRDDKLKVGALYEN